LELGILPIVNENDTVATDEIRFGDNDRLAALVAQVVQADALILLSDVSGLFDGPPELPGSKLISHVASMNDIADVQISGTGSAGVGLGGMTTKVEAARIATAAGIPTIVTSADLAESVLAGSEVGTLFTAAESKIPTRLLWLTYATTSQGSIVIDAGAVTAVVDKRLSLLPAGVVSIQGMFSAGDPVDVCDPTGKVLARGIVSFDSDELPGMIGKRTADLLQEFGTGFDREIIHRDDMVVL
jgi:glutamate 5-kinase